MSAPPSPASTCPVCGAKLKPGAHCLRCLMSAGLPRTAAHLDIKPAQDQPTDKIIPLAPPDLQKAAAVLPQVAEAFSGTIATTMGGRLPEKFGDYELMEELAHGGMGVVYLARQVSLDRVVALKFLLPGSFSSPELKERFRREAKAAAGLRHPNIVSVHHVGRLVTESDGVPNTERLYYCMDFIEGRSLAEVLRAGPLSLTKAATYMRTIAEAVHYAHERWVLHRDLKPSNILIDLKDTPHITDFGLAGKMEVRTDLTVTGQMMGTPGYLPPEMAAGKRDEVTAASDIYSLGAVLYECLAGRPPFQAETLQETLLRIRDEDPVAPSLINPSVPRDLETICLKCLEKNPAHRYATAQELAADLGCWLEHKPIKARPATMITQVSKWMRRNPNAGLGICTVVGGVVVFGLATLVHNRQMHTLVHSSQQQLVAHQVESGLQLAREHDFATAALWLSRAAANTAQVQPLATLQQAVAAGPQLLRMGLGSRLAALEFSPQGTELWLTSTTGAREAWKLGTSTSTQAAAHPEPSLQKHPGTFRYFVQATKPLALRDTAEILHLAVSADQRFLATSNAEGVTRLWLLSPAQPSPASQLEAELSTGHQLSPSGALQPLSRAELKQRLEQWQPPG